MKAHKGKAIPELSALAAAQPPESSKMPCKRAGKSGDEKEKSERVISVITEKNTILEQRFSMDMPDEQSEETMGFSGGNEALYLGAFSGLLLKTNFCIIPVIRETARSVK